MADRKQGTMDRRAVMDTLLKHPSVQDCKSSFVLERVKGTTAVPV